MCILLEKGILYFCVFKESLLGNDMSRGMRKTKHMAVHPKTQIGLDLGSSFVICVSRKLGSLDTHRVHS